MKKIEKLTPQQEAELVGFRSEWLGYGLSTERADRPRAQAAVTRMYELIGKKPPAFLWFDSPMSAGLAVGLLASLKDLKLWQQLRQQLWQQLRQQLWQQLRQQLGQQLWQQLGQQLDQQLDQQLWQQLDQQLRQQLGQQLGQQLDQQLRQQLGQQLDQQLRQISQRARQAVNSEAYWGQHEAAWFAFYTFGERIGVKYPEDASSTLKLWGELVQSCGWWMPYDGLCVMCERQSFVSFDERARLHNQTRAALEFADGYRLFVWHGTAVPENWITAPDKLDPKTALTWENIEQRRAAAEIIGWKRVLEQLQPTTINKDKDPEIGELIEVVLPDAGEARFLKVRCGTGRDFVLSVPREMKTAREANAWTYDLKPKEYKLEART